MDLPMNDLDSGSALILRWLLWPVQLLLLCMIIAATFL